MQHQPRRRPGSQGQLSGVASDSEALCQRKPLLPRRTLSFEHRGCTSCVRGSTVRTQLGPVALQTINTLEVDRIYLKNTTCTRLLWSWRRQASEMKRACMAVNHFLRERFPSKTWTSIAVLYNPSMPLHRDILNMIGHANHAVALGNFLEGRVWIEDENGQATTVLETKNGQKLLHGTWIDMHDAPVTFNARKYHMLEKHRGNMWALAAYTPQAFKHAAASHINELVELGFPVPVLRQA